MRTWKLLLSAAVVVVVLRAGGMPALAQIRMRDTRAERAAQIVRIRRFSGISPRSKVRTPEYRSNISRGSATPQEWFQVMVSYDSAPEWIDELTFRYYVMTGQREQGKKHFALFKGVVRYADIPEGRNHLSTAYLHPRAMDRYGEVVAVACEVVHEGKVIAEESDVAMKLPDQWWRNPLVVDNADVTVKDGYLLDRSRSPWALINIDDEEFIK
jgi:hypothetical protein